MSKKRDKQNGKYLEMRKKYLQAHPVCRARLKGCMLKASQVHHKMGRTGDLLCNELYWLPVCPNCHEFIERNPELAKELGFSISRL